MGLIVGVHVRLVVINIQVNKNLQLLCPKGCWCGQGVSTVMETVAGHTDRKMMASSGWRVTPNLHFTEMTVNANFCLWKKQCPSPNFRNDPVAK